MVLEAVKGIEKVRFFERWDDPKIAGRGSWAPEFVMVHGTAGSDSLVGLRTGSYGSHKPVPGANFLIARDGTLHVLTHRLAYHAGRGGPFRGVAAGMMNHRSWGLEFETWQRVRDLTFAQIETGAKLIAGLLQQMKRGLDRIIQHKEWAPRNKPHDTLYPTEWWRAHVASAMKKETKVTRSSLPGPTKKHSGEIGATVMHKTPVDAPVTVLGDGKWYDAATLVLPNEGEYLVSFQVRMPAAATSRARVKLARLDFGEAEPGKPDDTGHGWAQPSAKMFGEWERWDTPIEHPMSGGGSVVARILMPADSKSAQMRFVVKAKRIA